MSIHALRDRIHGLRGLGMARPVVPSLDAEWQQRLARLRELTQARKPRAARASGPAALLPGREVAPGLRVIETALSATRARILGLEWPTRITPHWSLDPSPVEAERLLIFDTETSGLSGGTGLKVFLLGVIRFQRQEWRMRQYLLTGLAGEHALLRALQSECRADDVLVSYNGKRFDVPALDTLCRLHGLDNPLLQLPHWDLLYPVRKAWRGQWPNCRLATAERQLLRKERHDDLPGSEAPRAWRNWLTQGASHELLRVLAHNRSDLESLLRLLPVLERRYRTG